MATELAFVLINPRTLQKSRTGGVLARYLARTQLELAAARMFGPSAELVERYADLTAQKDTQDEKTRDLLVNYIREQYAPDALTGKPQRVMLLVLRGENATQKVLNATGLIRDTFGDYAEDASGAVTYFEPAVMVGSGAEHTRAVLELWAEFSGTQGGLVLDAADAGRGTDEQTLVMLKPENFKNHSLRPGSIMDVLSQSELKIVAVKKFSMSVVQANAFYGPVKEVLAEKFADIGGDRLRQALKAEFGFVISDAQLTGLADMLNGSFAEHEFNSIVKYMTGRDVPKCDEATKEAPGTETCLALVYSGPDAISTIRNILGATDPGKAAPCTIRCEFGSSIRVNAAHASDSVENAQREMGIIGIETDTLAPLVSEFYS